MIKLNAGCGEFPARGWLNMDLHSDGPQPDIIGSLFKIPLDDGCCERVYCGHVMEHIHPTQMHRALGEIRRVLAPGGELMVVGPDIERAKLYAPEVIPAIEGGEGRWPGDKHKWISTGEKMVRYLNKNGWSTETMEPATVPYGWPIVSRAKWQFAVLAR